MRITFLQALARKCLDLCGVRACAKVRMLLENHELNTIEGSNYLLSDPRSAL